jgi:hypothetical protein
MIARRTPHRIAPQRAEFHRFHARIKTVLSQTETDPPLGLVLGPAGARDPGDRNSDLRA